MHFQGWYVQCTICTCVGVMIVKKSHYIFCMPPVEAKAQVYHLLRSKTKGTKNMFEYFFYISKIKTYLYR